MSDFYSVIVDREGCKHCKEGTMWTVQGDDETSIGQSWGHLETAQDVCDLMNMAYTAGTETTSVATEATEELEKLVEFFTSKQGEKIGRDGDYDNLSPAETAIRFMKKHV